LPGINLKMGEFERRPLIVSFEEPAQFTEVYGFAGSHGKVLLEGQLLMPANRPSKTILLFMHPATTLNLLPLPAAMASAGVHVMCCGSRYAKNDSALIMEKVVADMGAYIRHAKQQLGYEMVILVGWSGGGSLSVTYQAEAENPMITSTPGGEPYDLSKLDLIPADAMMSIAAPLSRAETLTEWIDPSIEDELDPGSRVLELDLYAEKNPNQPPYSSEFLHHYRAKQLQRNRRISQWVKETLDDLKRRNTGENERAFVVHRTMADPRWLDPAVDPNDRKPGSCYLGDPKTVNVGPVGLARFSTLRSWLSQWSYDDSNARTDANAGRITIPVCVIENSADAATPASHPRKIFELLGSQIKEFHKIQGATHYYQGQPEKLQEVVDLSLDWLKRKQLLVD
jgi:pimeloyl-ACP methyl ester carboxylesterase